MVNWAEQNNMALHESKFEFLMYNTPRSKLIEEIPFTSEWLEYNTSSDQAILTFRTIKELGVYLNDSSS